MTTPLYSQEALDAAAQRIAKDRGSPAVSSDDIALAGLVLNAAVEAEQDAFPLKTIKVPMSGLADTPDLSEEIDRAKQELQATVRGDDKWRHPDMYVEPVPRLGHEGDMFEGPDFDDGESYQERHHNEPTAEESIMQMYDENMAALAPEIYKHAHAFMTSVFGDKQYTPDSVGQLVDVFVPCLRIMNDKKKHPWSPDGALWRQGGFMPVMIFLRAKFMRYWYRTWIQGKRHDDSGYDGINFWGFSIRADQNDRWGELGEPALPEIKDES